MATDGSPGMVLLGFRVPEPWRDRLKERAEERAISVADLCRVILREFLYADGKP